MTDQEFQTKALGLLDAHDARQKEITANLDRADKETKKAFEDLHKSIKDTNASVEERVRKIERVNSTLANEMRAAHGDPRQRLLANDDKRFALRSWIIRSLGLTETVKSRGLSMRGLDEANTPGSTMIPNAEVEMDVYDALLRYGAYKVLDVRTVGTASVDIPIKTARAAAAFVDEAAAISEDSTKAGSKHTVTPKKLGSLVLASAELLEDASVNVVGDILDDMLEAIAYKLEWIGFTANGDADATDGGFSGLFYGGTNKVAANGNTTVETLDFEDVLACVTGVNAAVLSRNPRWQIHPTMLARLLAIKDSNGRPIFNTAFEAPALGSVGTILGFPVDLVGAAPSTNSANGLVAVFGDPKNQAIRIRRDFSFDRSEHFAFNADEIAFRATCRAASKTKIAGSTTILKLAAS